MNPFNFIKRYYPLFICYFFLKWRGYVVYSVEFNLDKKGHALINSHGFGGVWNGYYFAMGKDSRFLGEGL